MTLGQFFGRGMMAILATTILASLPADAQDNDTDAILIVKNDKACTYLDSNTLFYYSGWHETAREARAEAYQMCQSQSEDPASCRFSYCTTWQEERRRGKNSGL